MAKPTPYERIIARSAIDPNGCWTWQGFTLDGHGTISAYGRRTYVHRISYEHWYGPIPDGLTIDHLCRNRSCVNPEHLEAVTFAVNVLRGMSPPAQNARLTHCKRGHEFTPDNTYRTASGGRRCRECKRLLQRGGKGRGRGRFTEQDSERCQDCGLMVGVWWSAADTLWAAVAGRSDGSGVMCVGCFDVRASKRGLSIRWEATDAT